MAVPDSVTASALVRRFTNQLTTVAWTGGPKPKLAPRAMNRMKTT